MKLNSDQYSSCRSSTLDVGGFTIVRMASQTQREQLERLYHAARKVQNTFLYPFLKVRARARSHAAPRLTHPSCLANDCSTGFTPAFARPSPDSSPHPHFSRSTREYKPGVIRCTRVARARARYSDRTPRTCYPTQPRLPLPSNAARNSRA